MEIIRAKYYWFCFWVKNAHDIVEKELEKKWKTQVWWELIHNKPALDRLKKKWMSIIEDVEKINWNLIIRSHWISDKKKIEIRKKTKNVIDATCPYVTNVHNWAKKFLKENRKIVIIWDWNHPEMIWLTEDLDEFYCILSLKDINNLSKKLWKIWVIAQTTIKKETYDFLLENLKKVFEDVKEKNTICSATTERQDAIEELSKKVDILIIIWWTNSNNSKKLWEISKKNCPESYKIETKSELKKEWFQWKHFVWISAWASTPEWLIESVEEEIKKISN